MCTDEPHFRTDWLHLNALFKYSGPLLSPTNEQKWELGTNIMSVYERKWTVVVSLMVAVAAILIEVDAIRRKVKRLELQGEGD